MITTSHGWKRTIYGKRFKLVDACAFFIVEIPSKGQTDVLALCVKSKCKSNAKCSLQAGKYEEVEAMHPRALREYKKALSCEHPDTLSSINIITDF